jgi:hypothetical protein
MDTLQEAAIAVHHKDGSLMVFREHQSGLYFFDTAAASENNFNKTSPGVIDYLFLNTVASNKLAYTRREIEGAEPARTLLRNIGRPSEAEFADILQNNWIRNCPVTTDNARRALVIYGPEVHTIQGKTAKRQKSRTPDYQPIKIPAPIIAQHSQIRLFVDIFSVNGSPCFHTISEWIKFRTIAAIKNRTKRTLCQETQAVINMCEARGFTVTIIEGDREFACIKQDLLPSIPINIADADDHVAEVERSIRTVKRSAHDASSRASLSDAFPKS